MDIEKNELINRSGYTIKPDLIEKAMIGDSEEANQILKEAREIYLNEIRYRYLINNNFYRDDDLYIISKEWYKKWKEYVKYKTVKKTCRTPEIYIKMKPITFKIKPELNPGEIDNDDIIIKYKSNTLINEECYPLDKLKSNKKDYKIFLKKSFDIFKNRFGCKNIVKIIKRINRKLQIKSFDAFFLKFNVILIPRKESFIENPILKIYNLFFFFLRDLI